jgi:hypothetical protein
MSEAVDTASPGSTPVDTAHAPNASTTLHRTQRNLDIMASSSARWQTIGIIHGPGFKQRARSSWAGNDGKLNVTWTTGDRTPIAPGSTLPMFCVQQ